MDENRKIKLKMENSGCEMDIFVKYTKRKTIKISIEMSGDIFVVAPQGMNDDYLIKNIRIKEKWILQKLCEVKKIGYFPIDHKYVTGENFMYMGESYPLLILEDDSIGKPVADIIDGRFVITTNTRDISKLKKSMEIWFRERTLEKVKERIDLYQKYFSVEPKSIKVKEQKKRWASCTYKRGLLFNWRCSMAPIFVIDYIVVHEMCHMIHMNHSKEFWNLVEYIIPNYKERKKWLKENGFKMTI